jgi:hypothetical protein
MITIYYSSVLDHPVETVWSLIGDFNNYPAYRRSDRKRHRG